LRILYIFIAMLMAVTVGQSVISMDNVGVFASQIAISPSIEWGIYCADSGLYVNGVDSGNTNTFAYWQEQIGKSMSVRPVYRDANEGDFNQAWKDACDAAIMAGQTPMVMWLLWNREDRTEDPEWTYDAILSGKQDTYLEAMARQIRYYNQPIKIRMMHELNTAQTITDTLNYPWAASLKDADGNIINSPDKSADVWRYIVQKFKDVGADKVQWVYSVLVWPSVDSVGNPWNPVSFKSIYPGDAWVDAVGFDYYSFDVTNPVMPLADKNFKAMYDEVKTVTAKRATLPSNQPGYLR
jgi:hypothetical protein